MIQVGRSWKRKDYRFSFNGKEDESWDVQDYGFRNYDPLIARFISVDPLAFRYSYKTPYDFAENQPLWAIDLDGLEKFNVTIKHPTDYRSDNEFILDINESHVNSRVEQLRTSLVKLSNCEDNSNISLPLGIGQKLISGVFYGMSGDPYFAPEFILNPKATTQVVESQIYFRSLLTGNCLDFPGKPKNNYCISPLVATISHEVGHYIINSLFYNSSVVCEGVKLLKLNINGQEMIFFDKDFNGGLPSLTHEQSSLAKSMGFIDVGDNATLMGAEYAKHNWGEYFATQIQNYFSRVIGEKEQPGYNPFMNHRYIIESDPVSQPDEIPSPPKR